MQNQCANTDTQSSNKTPQTEQTRRGNKTYSENPFIRRIYNSSTTKLKTLKSEDADAAFHTDEQTAEIFDGTFAVTTKIEVETNQFLKIYANELKTLFQLGAAGHKVFTLIAQHVANNNDKLHTFHAYASIDQHQTQISRATYTRGIKELIDAEILAYSNIQNKYWINGCVVFNGNRLQIIREYRRTMGQNK